MKRNMKHIRIRKQKKDSAGKYSSIDDVNPAASVSPVRMSLNRFQGLVT
jgi:hypothetical protein